MDSGRTVWGPLDLVENGSAPLGAWRSPASCRRPLPCSRKGRETRFHDPRGPSCGRIGVLLPIRTEAEHSDRPEQAGGTGDGSVAAQDELGLDGATLEGASPAEGRTAMSLNTQDSGTEASVAAVAAAAAASVPAPEKENSRTVRARRFGIVTDESRDASLTAFGKDTLDDRYSSPGEKYQDSFARVADAYADDEAHAQRLYDYISKSWFMPATPVLSNGGTGRGLPISCYL
ncbi:hypothetical protein OY671_008566, partial [Metschnikowia pulcherrima]